MGTVEGGFMVGPLDPHRGHQVRDVVSGVVAETPTQLGPGGQRVLRFLTLLAAVDAARPHDRGGQHLLAYGRLSSIGQVQEGLG